MVPRSEASWGAAPGSAVAAGEWNKLQHSLRQDQHGSQEWTVRGLDTPGAETVVGTDYGALMQAGASNQAKRSS